jgi:hypothetical protein
VSRHFEAGLETPQRGQTNGRLAGLSFGPGDVILWPHVGLGHCIGSMKRLQSLVVTRIQSAILASSFLLARETSTERRLLVGPKSLTPPVGSFSYLNKTAHRHRAYWLADEALLRAVWDSAWSIS